MRDNMKTARAGSLAQQACLSVFGITEPDIEVKSSHRTYYRVKVPLYQLEAQWEKDYVIVVYDRIRKTIKRGPRKGQNKHELTIEQAFKRPLEFVVIPGVDLMKLIAEHNFRIQFLRPDLYRPPKLLVTVPLRYLKTGEPVELEKGHFRYGPEPSVCGEHIRDEPPF